MQHQFERFAVAAHVESALGSEFQGVEHFLLGLVGEVVDDAAGSVDGIEQAGDIQFVVDDHGADVFHLALTIEIVETEVGGRGQSVLVGAVAFHLETDGAHLAQGAQVHPLPGVEIVVLSLVGIAVVGQVILLGGGGAVEVGAGDGHLQVVAGVEHTGGHAVAVEDGIDGPRVVGHVESAQHVGLLVHHMDAPTVGIGHHIVLAAVMSAAHGIVELVGVERHEVGGGAVGIAEVAPVAPFGHVGIVEHIAATDERAAHVGAVPIALLV